MSSSSAQPAVGSGPAAGSERNADRCPWTRTIIIGGVLALVAGGASASGATAQESGSVVGRVTAESGAPVSEAQVYMPANSRGSLTRQNGSFIILEIPAGTYEIRAERIGFTVSTQQVTVMAGQSVEVNFELSSEALGLDEIVVTGAAGSARRREVGNSITQIDVASLSERPTRVADALQASAPGIEVSGVSGQVGGGTRIRLRGNSSVTQTNTPIIYVDGVRIGSDSYPGDPRSWTGGDRRPRSSGVTPSPINFINPNDIERIEVIKGSAATTLYGTEASAGVIQIFTKRGSQGAPVWNMEVHQGTMWMRKFGPAPEPFLRMDPYTCTGLFECGQYLEVPHTQNYSASVRAGGEGLQYFVSAQHTDESGVLPYNTNQAWSFRSNFTATPTKDIQIQWNSGYTNSHIATTQEGGNAEGITLNAFRAERNYFGTADTAVVAQTLDWRIDHFIDRFTTGGTVSHSPLANLTNRLTIGLDFSHAETRNLRPVGSFFWPGGALWREVYEDRSLTFDYVGTFSFDITDALTSSFSWGGQAIGRETNQTAAWSQDFPGAANPTVSSGALTQAYESLQKVWNAGFFFQDILGFDDKYFLTLGLRVDGNSAFGSGFGLQVYPKASGSWVISAEDWWQPAWGQVKLRTAYGQSGRAPGAFDAVRTWQGGGFLNEPAFTPRNVGNADLGPEVTGEFEVGFDGAWLDGRVSADFTYYRQITAEALLEVAQTPSLGFLGSQIRNVGKIRNAGMELATNFSPVSGVSWGWDLGFNVTTNNSEVLDLGEATSFSVGGQSFVVEGQPAPVKRVDVVTNPDERAAPEFERDVFLGPTSPTLMLGVTTSVRMPFGITLGARGDFRGGYYWADGASAGAVSRSVRWPICYPYYDSPEGVGSLALRDDTPAIWRARCTPSTGNSDMYTVPADYFRLRSLTAELPMGFAFPDGVTNAMLTVGLYNSWTWYNKDFLQWDPEMVGDPDGLVDSPGMRLPIPISLRASLRVQF